MRWHWFSAKKTPQAPALWLGNAKLDKHSRNVSNYYGLETKRCFFGLMIFSPKVESPVVNTAGMSNIEKMRLHRSLFGSTLKEAYTAVVQDNWNGGQDWKP